MLRKLLAILLTSILILSFGCQNGEQKIVEVPTGVPELECNKQIATVAVKTAAMGLGAILQNIEDENTAIETIREFIAPVRFYGDNSGYFYVYDTTCVNIAHATQPDLVGKDLKEYTDCKGKFVIQELSKMAINGGGFVDYMWRNPNTGNEDPKIGYVEMIPGTPYFIGDGVYIPVEM